MEPDTETVTISRAEYEALLKDAKWRECLENGGVDNWEYYGDALRDGGYSDEEEEDDEEEAKPKP